MTTSDNTEALNRVVKACANTACRGAPTEADLPVLTEHFGVSARELGKHLDAAFAAGLDESDPGADLYARLKKATS